MFEQIKKSPLVGLTLAIAGGYVLAHLVIRTSDYLWDNFLADFFDRNGWWPVFDIAFLLGMAFLAAWWFHRYGSKILARLRRPY